MHKFHHVADKLLPTPNELQQDLDWAQRRPLSQANSSPKLLADGDDPDCFLKALTYSEEQFRCSYDAAKPNQAWQLNQNPDSGFGSSSNDRQLQCVIANVHLLFTQRVQPARWMVGSEALATQAFPVVPFLWGIPPDEFPALCSFNLPRGQRTSRQMLVQAGNSMNVMALSVISLHGLTEWQRRPLPPLMANIRLSRSAALASHTAQRFDDDPRPAKRLRAKQSHLLTH